MKFGYFDLPNREYVITDPRTPVKWINYIGTRQFGGFLDHTGGALLCKDDPTFNRLTKYIQQMPSSDFKGTSLYLRIPFKSHAQTSEVLETSEVLAMQNDSYQIRRGEETSQGYQVFSPFFVPTLDPYQRFECRIGLGYTRWITEFYDLRAEITIFVPLGGSCELRDIQITNLGEQAMDVDAIPLVEYSHPDALKQFTNADWVPQTMQSKVVEDGEYKILIQYPFQYRDARINYLTSNQPAASFETDRKLFLGENEYGTFKSPISLFQPELGNTQALRGDNIAALLHHLGTIQPGMTRRLITQFGQGANLEALHPEIQRFRDAGEIEKELEKINDFWEGYLSAMQVDTPDESTNAMLNVYNPHQCYVTKTWSRYLSYYQLGLGSRGIGMRDSSQDVLAVLAPVPDESKEFLRTLLSFQRRDGSAMHQFNPLTLEGSMGDSAEMDDRPHYYSDDHLWCILAGIAYLKETGDLSFLEEIIPFYDKDKLGNSLESGSVFEHFQRGLDFTRNDLGKHGLPLLGYADWNDTVNLPSGAESLFTANLYGKTCLEMIGLLEHLGDFTKAEAYRRAYLEMKSKVDSSAWDGEWYIRYIDAEGNPIGSSKNTYGQIYLNGQTWAVISGFAPPDRARKAMEAVYSRLNTRYGIKLATPGYNGYDPKYGGVTTYPPGAKENCGIFVHPNPWAVIAETMLGNGNRAYQYYSQVNPAARNDMIEVYECEPYAYAQNILGDEHPQFGLARNSWLSGTASWSYLAATQWILGIRPEFKGLRINPCIPSAWKGFSVDRKFRGQVMHIEVHNPQRVCKGVLKMSIDGKTTEENIIPIDMPDDEHHVEVWLGN